MERLLRLTRIPFFILGLALFFAGERYLYGESYFLAARAVALGLMALSLISVIGLAGIAGRKGNRGEQACWWKSIIWQIALLLGSILYAIYAKSIGVEAVATTFMHKALLASWVLSYVLGFFLFVGIELAMSEGSLGPFAEPDRIRRAVYSWLTIGLMTSVLVCLNYIGVQKDKVFDWSYLKASEPGASTKALVGGLTEDLKVSVFFSFDSEVLPFVRDYFSRVDALSGKLSVEYLDKDLEPAKSEALKVGKNGTIVLSKGTQQEKITIGTNIRSARKTLSQIDEKFLGAFKGLDVTEKAIYFTRGHGELEWSSAEEDPLKKIGLIESWLRNQNYTIKTLDVTSGSTKEIQGHDSVVVIAGPTKPFLQEEVDVLREYLDKGGKLFVLLDLDGDTAEVSIADSAADPLKQLLKEAGISYQAKPLANVSKFLSATKSSLDHWFLYTNVFASHESIAGLAKNDEKVAIFALRAGSFEIVPRNGNWTAAETVRTLSDTFIDFNANRELDADSEKQKSYSLGAAAVYKGAGGEGRIVAFGDATVLSDAVIRNPGNILYAAGAISWLVGKPDAAVVASSEEDVKIQHSKKEDAAVFYGSVGLVPLIILGVGSFANRRGRKKKEKVTNHAA